MSYLPCELQYPLNSNTVAQAIHSAYKDHIAFAAVIRENATTNKAGENNFEIPVAFFREYKFDNVDIVALGNNFPPAATDAKNTVRLIKESGSLVGISYIKSAECLDMPTLRSIDYAQVFKGEWTSENSAVETDIKKWMNLLDFGCHIAAVYARGTEESNTTHYGCTYIDFDSEVSPKNALKAVRMGKCTASAGAKFFFRVHQKGKTYNIGETMRKGMAIFSFFTDIHSREKNKGSEDVEYKTIRLITNSGRCVMQSAVTERHVRVDLEKHHWYSAQLWGTVNGEDKILAVTSPVYTE